MAKYVTRRKSRPTVSSAFANVWRKAFANAGDVVQTAKGRKWDKEVVYDVRLGEKSVIQRASP